MTFLENVAIGGFGVAGGLAAFAFVRRAAGTLQGAAVAGVALAIAGAGIGLRSGWEIAVAILAVALAAAAFVAGRKVLAGASAALAFATGPGALAAGLAIVAFCLASHIAREAPGERRAAGIALALPALGLVAAPSLAAAPAAGRLVQGIVLAGFVLVAALVTGPAVSRLTLHPRARSPFLTGVLFSAPLALLALLFVNSRLALFERAAPLERFALGAIVVAGLMGLALVAIGLTLVFSTENRLKPWIAGALLGVPCAVLAGGSPWEAALVSAGWAGSLVGGVGIAFTLRLARERWRGRALGRAGARARS